MLDISSTLSTGTVCTNWASLPCSSQSWYVMVGKATHLIYHHYSIKGLLHVSTQRLQSEWWRRPVWMNGPSKVKLIFCFFANDLSCSFEKRSCSHAVMHTQKAPWKGTMTEFIYMYFWYLSGFTSLCISMNFNAVQYCYFCCSTNYERKCLQYFFHIFDLIVSFFHLFPYGWLRFLLFTSGSLWSRSSHSCKSSMVVTGVTGSAELATSHIHAFR